MRALGPQACILLALTAGAARAQSPAPPAQDPVPEFNTARTPVSPAFTLLGVAPTEVERPTTPAALGLALVGTALDTGGVPEDFAFEFSPYWLVSHPRLSWRSDETRSVGDSLARTASVSLATAETGKEDAPVTSLAVGLRASPFSGRLSRRAKIELALLELQLQRRAEAFARVREEKGLALSREQILAALKEGQISPDEAATLLETAKAEAAALAIDSKEYKAALEKVQAEALAVRQAVEEAEEDAAPFSGAREGFVLEIAGAMAWDFADAAWDARDKRNAAFWITPSWVTDTWSVVGIGRWRDGGGEEDLDSFDLGARLIRYRGRYALSAEYVRHVGRDGAPSGDRFAALGEIAFGGAWATVSVGQGFKPDGAQTVIASLGLSFNLSGSRYKFQDAAK
jgi:hypothetical protein